MSRNHYEIRAIFNDGAVIEVTGSSKKITEQRYFDARNAAERFDRPIFQITTPRGVTKEVAEL